MKTLRHKKPTISVIIPVFNELLNLKTLVTSLSAILRKSRMSYELIFVDDHSTDGSYEYLREIKNRQIIVIRKSGKKGKAYSLIEGFLKANGTCIAMIDADLQYPPDAIPEMVKLLDTYDVVVASRTEYNDLVIRKLLSKTFRYIFGRMLFGLKIDIQSGLKVFTKEALQTVLFTPQSPWAFDLEFLYRVRYAGYRIGSVNIIFSPRKYGASKIKFIKSSYEIGSNALLVRMKRLAPHAIAPLKTSSMLGAGVGYKNKKYITHTTLPIIKSAIQTFSTSQKLLFASILLLLVIGFSSNTLITARILIALLSAIYFIDVLFNLTLLMKTLKEQQEIIISQDEMNKLLPNDLPLYTILSPLYREAHLIPQFIDAMLKLEWPKNKLDVILLLEEDDRATIEKARKMKLPSFVRIVIVPDSSPRTKPKACNYGLAKARGKYLVVYDAEDIPDPYQLKKAYVAFQKVNKEVICLQAKLNYYNPSHNLLTRFFTAEYSLWFDITLPGLQGFNATIPLGGTSNHFRVADLKKIHGWDPFNVTEDADLGVRLFKEGYRTAIIDSTTLEEANSKLKNWMRQRSRWIKGYMQTYLVHMRESFYRKHSIHTLFIQLTIGGKVAFILINPFLWIITILYFAWYEKVGPTLEALYVGPIFYMAIISTIIGNFMFMYSYMIACVKRGQWSLVKYIFFIPIYWLMLSIAAFIAFYQLIFKPHYWEKTDHGFHLIPSEQKVLAVSSRVRLVPAWRFVSFLRVVSLLNQFHFPRIVTQKKYMTGSLLLFAAVGNDVLNFAFNTYLAKMLTFSSFALVGLVNSFFYIAMIPFLSIMETINYRTAFLEGKYARSYSYHFYQRIRNYAVYIGIIATVIWILLTPSLKNFFHTQSVYPFLIFAPVWLIGFMYFTNKGYLSGRLFFGLLSVLLLVEPIFRLISAFALVQSGYSTVAYAAIPLSITLTFLLSCFVVIRNKGSQIRKDVAALLYFPKKFFASSFLVGLSTMSFISLDLVLANHYLSKTDAGQYALVSLIGKCIFFLGALGTQFMIPLVSRSEGARQSSQHVFQIILWSNIVLTGLASLLLFSFAGVILPIMFGEKALAISPFITEFSIAMMCFSISRVFLSYHMVKRVYLFPAVAVLLSVLQIWFIASSGRSVESFVSVMAVIGIANLFIMLIMHIKIVAILSLQRNLQDFLKFFVKSPQVTMPIAGKYNILILNWRDSRHIWAGGAEVYVQQLAKRWVKDGNNVAIFCGNDRRSLRYQTIHGVKIVRFGGTYTVYLWAMVYYLLRFRGQYDVVIDCENGIPFFSPLYVRKPIFLLIHHVHQEVFRQHLLFPFSAFAAYLERRIMPLVYKKMTTITVSESSKKDILKLGFVNENNIKIIYNGINNEQFSLQKKSLRPLFMCLGRLKPYKNIDIAIRAFVPVVGAYPDALLAIVGEGESKKKLKKLAKKLNIENNVIFYGRVSERKKARLLASSWVVVQPSMIEGWGITVIEANASGTPVIASDVSGLKDAVVNGETGILVPTKNVTAFSSAMLSLINKAELREQLSKQALLWSRNFNWEKSAITFYGLIQARLGEQELVPIEKVVFARNEQYE